MRIVYCGWAGLFFTAPLALAQNVGDRLETDLAAETTVLVSTRVSENGAVPKHSSALYDLRLRGGAEYALDNGALIGVRAGLRAQADHRARPSGLGSFPSVADRPAGVVSGLGLGGADYDTGPRVQLETAYIYIDGGYGEVSIGRDTGIAARFHEGDVSVLTAGAIVDPALDASGLNIVRTRADLTGPSTKISYVTPRIIGVRAGISYTPETDVAGLDRDATRDGRHLRAGIHNTVEVGLNASRRLPDRDVRLRGAVSYSTGEIDAPPGQEAVFADRAEVWAAGFEAEFDSWSLSANWLNADEGLAGGENYSAWSVGVAAQRWGWTGSLTYGGAEIDALGADGYGFSVAAHRQISETVSLGLAWQSQGTEWRDHAIMPVNIEDLRAQSVVVEITLALEK